MLRLVFHLALRQAEGFATGVLRLLGQELRVPDRTTLSRRSQSFAGRHPKVLPTGPMHRVIDSTGLKLFGQGEWDAEKHGRTRRSWRKLHLAVEAGTGEIVACVLTDNGADEQMRTVAMQLTPQEMHLMAEFYGGADRRALAFSRLARRLNSSGRGLQTADAATPSVTQVATSYDLWELGRFSVSYRSLFGESPSASLRRPPEDPRPQKKLARPGGCRDLHSQPRSVGPSLGFGANPGLHCGLSDRGFI